MYVLILTNALVHVLVQPPWSSGLQPVFGIRSLLRADRPRVRNPAMNTSCFSFRAVSSHLSVSPQLPAHGHIPGSSHGAHHHPYSKNVNLKNLKNQCTNVYVPDSPQHSVPRALTGVVITSSRQSQRRCSSASAAAAFAVATAGSSNPRDNPSTPLIGSRFSIVPGVDPGRRPSFKDRPTRQDSIIICTAATMRVLNVLRHWVSKHSQDFESDLRLRNYTIEFLQDLVCSPTLLPAENKAASQLLRLLTKEEQAPHKVDLPTLLSPPLVKRARYDEKATLPVLGFLPINKPIFIASHEVAHLISKQAKPHTIDETLVKSVVLKMAIIMLRKEAEVNLSQILLLTRRGYRRFQSKPGCCIRALCERRRDKEDFLFCKLLTTTKTKVANVKKLVDNFFKDNCLSWDMVSVVCSDGAPVMLGIKSGFGTPVKADAPHIIVTHCILYRHALATKILPPKLAGVFTIVVECVNYVRTSALRHRIFSELCKEMGSEFKVLLYHSKIRWLSQGEVLNRVFAVRVELAVFFQEHHHCHADCVKNSEFIFILTYLADIFAALNHLNQKMQGGGVNIIEREENLKASELFWKRRTENNNLAKFPLMDDCVSKIEDVSGNGDISVPAELKQAIATHLNGLAKSLGGYFPTRKSYPAWVKQPFTFSVEAIDVNDKYLDEIIEIQHTQVQQQLFRTATLSTFWCQQMVTYPVIAKKAVEIFISFVTTYLCEQSFSRLLDVKTKKRNRLCCENDMRVAFAKVKPRISELVSERQQQKLN
ncbi:HAT C-terminal dimerization domain [Trinorchestia longiramus]|nr:HAT C-terminal dimerization domain [Trinorchestia longiramus]